MRRNTNIVHKIKNENGFTLIEILLAIFIFAIVMGMITSAVYTLVEARDRTSLHSEKLAQAQYAMLILERDNYQIINRPIINENGLEEPAFYANNYETLKLEFTRTGIVNPNSLLNRSSLLRVAYLVIDNKLIRRVWYSVDRSPKSKSEDEVLLTGVKNFTINILDQNNVYIVPNGSAIQDLPKAIKIEMIVDGLGVILRSFSLTE